MRIATFNVNGIRAATKRGFVDWLRRADLDVVALQEVRCPPDLIPAEAIDGFNLAYDPGTIRTGSGWWSWRGRSWDTDAGWRIDYQLASPGLAERAVSGGTDRAASYATRMSDHDPVIVQYAD